MISSETVAEIIAAVKAGTAVSSIRAQFPRIHFTECSADDINPRFKPVQEIDDFEFYLIAGSTGHCLELTNDLESATGVVIAAKADE